MLVVTCPYCRQPVLRKPDGSCPVCGRVIGDAQAEPLVIHTGTVVSDGRFDDSPASGGRSSEPFVRPATRAESSHEAILRFSRRLFEITPHVVVTRAMVAANAVVFVLMVLSGAGLFSPNADTLVAWGANYGPQTLDGQWWRLLTCMFVHIGLIHVALNMWVLWDVGHLVERLVGNVGFLVLYLVSGLFGSLASVYWNPYVTSAGASGAVFGVFGALFGFMLLRGDSVPKEILRSLRSSGLTFLAYNLIFGLSVRGIDTAAHVGGFVAGLACGVMMSQPLDRVAAITRSARNLATLAAATVLLAIAVQAAPDAPVDIRVEWQELAQIEQQVQETYGQANQQARDGQITAEQFAEIIESQVLPPWQELRRRIDQLDGGGLPARQRQGIQKLQQDLAAQEDAWRGQLRELRK
jgi:rhomboid protease GluP